MILLTLPCVLFSLAASTVEGAEIFAFFPHGGTSHYNVPEIYLKALAARGHNVTVVTPFSRQPESPPNFHVIDMSVARPPRINHLPFEIVTSVLQSTYNNFQYISKLSRDSCEAAFSMPTLQELLKQNRKFDLVVTEIFGADCGVGFAWKFDAPLISMFLSRREPWSFDRVGNTNNPSYMRSGQSSYDTPMNFLQRLTNTYWYVYFSLVYRWSHNGRKTDEISRRFFGADTPSVNEIVDKTALVFANNHFTIDQSYPLLPNYVEIGGIHVKKPKPLPQVIVVFYTSV